MKKYGKIEVYDDTQMNLRVPKAKEEVLWMKTEYRTTKLYKNNLNKVELTHKEVSQR